MDEVRKALESLQGKRQETQQELDKLDAAIAQLQSILTGEPVVPGPHRSYEGLGIADAAVRFIREAGRPCSTREIADALRMRGVKTTSRNYTATVYAVLAASKDRILRTPNGAWDLTEHKSESLSSASTSVDAAHRSPDRTYLAAAR